MFARGRAGSSPEQMGAGKGTAPKPPPARHGSAWLRALPRGKDLPSSLLPSLLPEILAPQNTHWSSDAPRASLKQCSLSGTIFLTARLLHQEPRA